MNKFKEVMTYPIKNWNAIVWGGCFNLFFIFSGHWLEYLLPLPISLVMWAVSGYFSFRLFAHIFDINIPKKSKRWNEDKL